MYSDRQQMVLDLRRTNPDMKAAAIAREIGVTRERVRQLLVKLGLPTRVGLLPVKICPQCSKPMKRINRLFCSMKCFSDSTQIFLRCMECGSNFKRRKKLHNHNLRRGQVYTFCNKSCFGRYFGTRNRSDSTRNILKVLERSN